jgi:hypothetical protein
MRFPISSIVFVTMLLGAVTFITLSSPDLPPLVASHFDAAGNANSVMVREDYVHFMLWIGVALPMVLVGVMAFVYSRASNLKLPNSEYWLAPQNIAATRLFLAGHSVWFGSILVAMIAYLHWLVLKAHQTHPPHLSSTLAIAGLIAFLIATLAWALVLLLAFRLPNRH